MTMASTDGLEGISFPEHGETSFLVGATSQDAADQSFCFFFIGAVAARLPTWSSPGTRLSFHIGCRLAGRVAPPALFSETRRIAARKEQCSLFDPAPELLLPFLLLHSVGATAYP